MTRRLSLPAEHGGYLTAAGAGLTAAVVAPRPGVALVVGLAVLAAFLARGVVDRLGAGKPLLRWDRPWLALLAGCAVLPALPLAPRAALVTLGLALAIVGASLWARRARRQRDVLVEAVGMTFLGASAGWMALAAGAPAADAAVVALILGAHAGLAVPLVRTELRRRERDRAGLAIGLTVGVILAAALGAAALGRPFAAVALLPRLAQAGVRRFAHDAPAAHPRPAQVGLRETLELLVAAGALAVAL